MLEMARLLRLMLNNGQTMDRGLFVGGLIICFLISQSDILSSLVGLAQLGVWFNWLELLFDKKRMRVQIPLPPPRG